MPSICGMTLTGREFKGPDGDLVEVKADNGLAHTALVFAPKLRGHPALNSSLQAVIGFLEDPQIPGVLKLADPADDHLAYDPVTLAIAHSAARLNGLIERLRIVVARVQIPPFERHALIKHGRLLRIPLGYRVS